MGYEGSIIGDGGTSNWSQSCMCSVIMVSHMWVRVVDDDDDSVMTERNLQPMMAPLKDSNPKKACRTGKTESEKVNALTSLSQL